MRFACFLMFVAVTMAALAGCSGGPRLIRVKAQLVDSGKPIEPDENSSINIIFIPRTEAKEGITNHVGLLVTGQEGKFDVKGRDPGGIPVGKYRVRISPSSMKASAMTKSLRTRFDRDDSPLIVDVVDDNLLIIDVGKK